MANAANVENIEEASASSPAHQFLTFTMNERHYGVNIISVREIRGWESPTPMPESPEYMLGVTNLRGEMVPIFDLLIRFNQGKADVTAKHVIIVVQIGSRMVGLLADAVSDIIDAMADDIKEAPIAEKQGTEGKYVQGLIATEDEMVILLDTNKLFDDSELEQIHGQI